jgi:hypothetical protein
MWFTRKPGNLGAFQLYYLPHTQRITNVWHAYAVRQAILCEAQDIREFLPWLLRTYRQRVIARSLTLPRHHRDRREIARALLALRVYRKEVARLLT